jgi:hypothetical protein
VRRDLLLLIPVTTEMLNGSFGWYVGTSSAGSHYFSHIGLFSLWKAGEPGHISSPVAPFPALSIDADMLNQLRYLPT